MEEKSEQIEREQVKYYLQLLYIFILGLPLILGNVSGCLFQMRKLQVAKQQEKAQQVGWAQKVTEKPSPKSFWEIQREEQMRVTIFCYLNGTKPLKILNYIT